MSTARRSSPPGASASGSAPSPGASASLVVLLALAAPVIGLKTAMPSIKVLPEDASARIGYDQVQQAFGDGAPGTLQIVVDKADAEAAAAVLANDPGHRRRHAGDARRRRHASR